MNLLHIASINRVVNMDQVVDMVYTEPFEGTDEDTGKPVSLPAVLSITTTALVIGHEYAWDGETIATAPVSQIISIRGSEAESVWERLSSYCNVG